MVPQLQHRHPETCLSKLLASIVPSRHRQPVKNFVRRLRRGLSPAESSRVDIIKRVDTHLSHPERLLLFSLVRGMRPQSVLEIGTWRGASAAIIAAALEDNGAGTVVGIDPLNLIEYPKRWYFGRFTLVEAPSPAGIARAREIAGVPFDFVHMDGINIYSQVSADLSAVLPHLAERALILVNNPLHFGVDQAVCEALSKNDRLVDCGFLNAVGDPNVIPEHAYTGLRLLRWGVPVDAAAPLVEAAFTRVGKVAPHYEPDLIDHDVWYCREIKACPRCAAQ